MMRTSPKELYDQALRLIRASELSEYFDQLAPRLDFSIDIQTEGASENDIALGAYKVGGSPDVTPDFVWPLWNDEPLTFLAQFELSSLAPLDCQKLLPASGMLSFFSMLRPMGFEPEDSLMHGVIGQEAQTQGAWRVVHTAPSARLERRTSPHTSLLSSYPPQRVSSLECNIGLPDTYEMIAPDGVWDEDDFWGDAFEEYIDLWSEIDGLSNSREAHQLLGYARYRQNDMRANAAQFGRRNRSQMRLMAQFSSDSHTDLNFAGDGYGYFFIEKNDLKAQDFSRTYFGVQR